MFTVTSTFAAGAKPPVVRTWENLDKMHVVDRLENVLINVLQRLNHMASDEVSKRNPTPVPNTNPVLVKYSLVIQKDGKNWSTCALEWYDLGEERQAVMLGLLTNQLNAMPSDVSTKEKKGGHKKP